MNISLRHSIAQTNTRHRENDRMEFLLGDSNYSPCKLSSAVLAASVSGAKKSASVGH